MWLSDRTNLIKVKIYKMIKTGKIRRLLARNENNKNKDKNKGKIITNQLKKDYSLY